MTTNTVYRLTRGGGIASLNATNEPIPSPASHELLVRVRAVSLNYRDVVIAQGTYPLPTKDVVIPCSDMSGEVIALGPGVDSLEWTIGDRVVSPVSHVMLYGPSKDNRSTLGGLTDGTLRGYMTIPAHALVKIPKESKLDYAHWAALVTVGVTAWNSLYGGDKLRPGQTVLALGTGGVSLASLILAKAAGARTIITSSSDEKLALVKEKYGIDHGVNYNTQPNWSAEVQCLTHGHGADHIIEVGGVGTVVQSFESVAWGGTISMIGFLSSVAQEDMPDVAMLTILKGVTLRGILAGSKQMLEEAVTLVAAQNLELPIDRVFGSSREEVVEAFELVGSGKMIGKVCIRMD